MYENDVHCAIDGYSKLAAMKNELTESFDHVGVVSVGDFAQGAPIGEEYAQPQGRITFVK